MVVGSRSPLTEQVALVTGASSGIGLQVAEDLALAGVKVVMCARRTSKLEDEAERIRTAGGTVSTTICDVSSPQSLDGVFAYVEREFGGLDLVFANAGIEGDDNAPALEEYPDASLDAILRVNVGGVIGTLKRAVPFFRKRGGGVFFISGSVSGLAFARCWELSMCFAKVSDRLSSNLPYSVTKAAVDQVARAAAGFYKRDNVTVVSGAYAAFASEMMDRGEQVLGKNGLTGFNPLFRGEVGDPHDIAKVVLALADGSSKFQSGDTLVIDHDAVLHAKHLYATAYGGGDDANMGWPSFHELKSHTKNFKGDPYDWTKSQPYARLLQRHKRKQQGRA